ncbi:RPM1-interacting protein 4-like [Oryza brachyantha]|uniref:RPM1-interacting protein 4-like n=1 Tax=Oryza brachyantha TaxID=4533 RepID=UPI001ADB9022|nr:RPM1-interacting protein 4-like [Oryza brachyantha]
MAKRPSVPKFGTWDGDNVGYTVYFDKVRENKGATAPPLHRPFNANDPVDNPRMISVGGGGGAPPSSARPATSSGGAHRDQQQRRPPPDVQQHRRTGSNSSVSSDPGGAPSKFAPPPQYHPRPSPHHGQHDHGHGYGYAHGHGHHQHNGGGGRRAPPQQAARHHHQAAPKARSASASPNDTPNRQRPSAVPKFGVWDEQNGAAAAQGFTVMFDNVKRNRDAARGAAAAGVVPRSPQPEISFAEAKGSRDHSLMSKMFGFGCFHHPTTRE